MERNTEERLQSQNLFDQKVTKAKEAGEEMDEEEVDAVVDDMFDSDRAMESD